MTTYSNDSNKKSKELQIPAGQSSSRSSRPANAQNRTQAPAKRPASSNGNRRPAPSNGTRQSQMARPATTNNRRPNGNGKRPPQKRPMTKKKKFKILYITLAIIFALSIVSIVAAKFVVPAIKAFNAVNKNRDTSYTDADVNNNFDNENDAAHMKGYLTLAVFGIDTRAVNDDTTKQIDDSDSRSDVIMIVNVNTDTKKIKLLSVYRDTYLYIGQDKNGNMKCDKINHAYSKGKALNAINALNKNLDLNIKDYVTVDFSIVAQCIDAVGGIELEILDREIERFNKDGSYRDAYPLINHYIDEINELTNSNSPHITKSGVQHVDGVQATAYARVRYCDTDFQRSERQRTVLMKMFEKAKESDISTILKIAEVVAPQIVTSLEWSEITNLAKYAMGCEIEDSQGFPFNLSNSNKLPGSKTWYNFSEDLVLDVSQLHSYLFNQSDYAPTSAVRNISAYINKKRGKGGSSDTSSSSSSSSSSSERTDEPEETYTPKVTVEPESTPTFVKSTIAPATKEPEQTVTVITKEPATPTPIATVEPTVAPTIEPTVAPTIEPTVAPTTEPEDPDEEEPDDPNNVD